MVTTKKTSTEYTQKNEKIIKACHYKTQLVAKNVVGEEMRDKNL